MKTSVQLLLAFAMVMLVRAQDPVNVSLYFESGSYALCSTFITEQLWPAYVVVPEIFTVDFVPFGNAKFYANGTSWDFICEHGSNGCDGNKIYSCALYFYPDNVDNVPFISCESETMDPIPTLPYCAGKYNLDWDKISSCAYGDQGSQLLHDNGVKTQALPPPKMSLPWITINGEWTEENNKKAEYSFIELICDTYTGTRPDACP